MAGIFRQEISLKERRVQPLLHPEDLLADVVVDHIRSGQGLEMGQDEDDVGEDGRHQEVEYGGIDAGGPESFMDQISLSNTRKVL